MFSTGLKNWKGDELFSVGKPNEPACDHLHTFMISKNVSSIGEL
jgi:hypothetical protein